MRPSRQWNTLPSLREPPFETSELNFCLDNSEDPLNDHTGPHVENRNNCRHRQTRIRVRGGGKGKGQRGGGCGLNLQTAYGDFYIIHFVNKLDDQRTPRAGSKPKPKNGAALITKCLADESDRDSVTWRRQTAERERP